jgi:hypothetical protein
MHLQNEDRRRKPRRDAPRPPARRQSKSEYRAPNPGASRVAAGRPDPSAAQRSVYHGRDRAGSFRRRSDSAWIALDRRGRELGVFSSETAAVDAIEAAAEAP